MEETPLTNVAYMLSPEYHEPAAMSAQMAHDWARTGGVGGRGWGVC